MVVTVPLHRDSQGQLEQLKQVQMMRSQQAERSLQEYKVEMERSTSQLFQQMKDEVIWIVGGCGHLSHCYPAAKHGG